jgi:hypothetical protein
MTSHLPIICDVKQSPGRAELLPLRGEKGCCALVRPLFDEEFLKLSIREIAASIINRQTEEVSALNAESTLWQYLEAPVAYRPVWSPPPEVSRSVKVAHFWKLTPVPEKSAFRKIPGPRSPAGLNLFKLLFEGNSPPDCGGHPSEGPHLDPGDEKTISKTRCLYCGFEEVRRFRTWPSSPIKSRLA